MAARDSRRSLLDQIEESKELRVGFIPQSPPFAYVNSQKRLLFFLPTGILGGVAGGLLLLHTSAALFEEAVPFLILTATVLLASQKRIQQRLLQKNENRGKSGECSTGAIIVIFLASVYGGYFGAGVSVIILAVLGILLNDSLTRLNALKQAISLIVNVASAIYFLFSGKVLWPVAIVMALFSVTGGVLGGLLSDRIRESTLRLCVVIIGFSVSIYYFLHLFHKPGS
ncbi:MAG: TSUP family transporter [Candidatus Xenobiia bacterium LiM19]